jgi:hypothetical protein
MQRPGPLPDEEVIELDIGNVFLRMLDGLYFLVLNISLFVGFCFVFHQVEINTIAMDRGLMIAAAVILGSFITGVTVGLKISRQKGGLLALSFAILAFIGVTYLLQHDLPFAAQIGKYVPLINSEPPGYVPYLVPIAGMMGILCYRFFTVNPD